MYYTNLSLAKNKCNILHGMLLCLHAFIICFIAPTYVSECAVYTDTRSYQIQLSYCQLLYHTGTS